MRRVEHRHRYLPSVVVAIVDKDGVLAFKAESQAPVAANAHGPVTCEIAMQRMQMPSREIHFQRTLSFIQREQLALKPLSVGRLNAGF